MRHVHNLKPLEVYITSDQRMIFFIVLRLQSDFVTQFTYGYRSLLTHTNTSFHSSYGGSNAVNTFCLSYNKCCFFGKCTLLIKNTESGDSDCHCKLFKSVDLTENI